VLNTYKKKQITVLEKLITPELALYEKKFPIILFFSPKSGCTSLVRWFFFQIGLLQKAIDYNPWVHLYRGIYQSEQDYKSELTTQLLLDTPKKVTYKLVRNPFKRAVSSFFAEFFIKEVMQNVHTDTNTGFSFIEFLYQIKKIGASKDLINIHFAQQYVEGEELFIQHHIKLEDFESEIKNIEHKYDLLQSPLSDILTSTHHNSKIMTLHVPSAESIKMKSLEGNLPTYESFYNKETIDLVRAIYKKDFEAYGYNQDF
jgi:hypothetical protein